MTTELNIHLEVKNVVPTKTTQQELHKSSTHNRAAIAKPPVTENNTERLQSWYNDCKTWMSGDWKYVIWSDELDGPECLVPTVEHAGGSVMIWVQYIGIPLVL